MVEVVQKRHSHQKALLACQKVDVSEGLASVRKLVQAPRAKFIYTRRCHVKVIGRMEQRRRSGGPCVCFILRHLSPGLNLVHAASCNRDVGSSVYHRDEVFVNIAALYGQASSSFIKVMSDSSLRI
jgi:hypothetical protein